MRPCRGGSRGPHSPFHSEGTTDMQSPTVQTEQWSWILQTVWGWIWGGLSWIVDWQAYVFRLVLSGNSFWEVVGKVLLLLFPTFALVAGVWGDRKSTRLNSSHLVISYAVFCLKKKNTSTQTTQPHTYAFD